MTYTHPAMTWLIKNDPDAALAVFHRLRDDYYTHGDDHSGQPHLDPREGSRDDAEAHDVPDVEHTSETMSESTQDGPDEVNPEMLHEVKPGLHEMLRSAGGIAWPWCGVRVKRDGKIKWEGEPWAYSFTAQPSLTGKHLVTLAGLTYYTRPGARRGFDGGMLLSFINDKGRIERPDLKANKPRGGKKPHRVDPEGYLALKGAVPSPLTATAYQRPLSGERAIGDFYVPLPREAPSAQDPVGRFGVAEARALLQQLGIDGSVPFDQLPFPATRGQTKIAKGARFIGGMSGRCQTASAATIGNWEPSEPIPANAAEILDEVSARGTLQSIGIRLGFQGGYADRAGKKALLAAGRALVADNDNNLRKKIAA
ncbi:hypothetical protein [Rhizobium leucaenae]|uniref:hypothetical protein n=1 Tax=Rhizobium leucaenae TaxID=29450 RepID=UPI00161E7852|nr:hypothetical protein [Rhizobium leucaenae]MBB6299420.1 hypothetical protein [Rhizobium leucaenae]